MKISKEKLQIAMARACYEIEDIEKAGISRGTYFRALNGECVRPGTAGKLAKALKVDVTEIIE